ncbi:hypothetical protein ACN42_g11673, partial [Penicillium freii]
MLYYVYSGLALKKKKKKKKKKKQLRVDHVTI